MTNNTHNSNNHSNERPRRPFHHGSHSSRPSHNTNSHHSSSANNHTSSHITPNVQVIPKKANTTSPTMQRSDGTTIAFKDLGLIEPLMRALTKEGYTNPTPIQAKAIPPSIEGKDLIGIAQTGTGKTAAFTLPILQRMTEKFPRIPRVLVLAPTRELAAQIGESFLTYGQYLKFKHTVIFGGVGQGPQVSAIQRGVDIIIATPGRLLDLMQQGRLNLNGIDFFVLDEADRMLDMGFIHDIRKIITRLPQQRQTLFFSATMSGQISELASKLLKNPVRVEVAPQSTTVERIAQNLFYVDSQNKEKLLLELLNQKHLTRVLVFTRTKHKANKVEEFLNKNGIRAEAIHGNKSQNHRMHALNNFKNGVAKVLVATDIAARGIDIDDISHVINFELPNEPESYVHRIGRTARAGSDGTAYSFCSADERSYLRDIENLIRLKINVAEHTFHSEHAKTATGSAARPPPRGGFGRNRGGGNRGGSSGGSGGSGRPQGRFGGQRSGSGQRSNSGFRR